MKLPIRETVFEVFEFLWENRRDLMRMIAAPVLALSIAGIGLAELLRGSKPAAEAGSLTGSQILGLALAFALPTLFYVMFAVAWHRRCLKPEEQTTILSALRWDRRKTLFLFRFFVISAIAIVGTLPVLFITAIVGGTGAGGLAAGGVGSGTLGIVMLQVGKMIVALVAALLQVRLALWLPAAALDQKMTLMDAWVIGRNNSWRLFAVLLLSIAPTMLLIILVSSGTGAIGQATGLSGSLTYRLIANLAFNFAYYILIAASVSALSMSYRALRQTPSPGMPYHM